MAIFPGSFMDSTVVVGTLQTGSQISWMATGFLVGRYEGVDASNQKKYSIYFITNKHVVENQRTLQLQFNCNTGVSILSCNLYNGKTKIFSEHPNSDVDVIACRVDINGALQNGTVACFFELDTQSLSKQQMKATGVCEGSIVYALGFPVGIARGLVDNIVKAPICRMGCISKIEHLYHNTNDYCYIIDAQTFPGNSGGPVVNRPEIGAITGTPYNNTANLIGIVSAYLPYAENLISAQTGRLRMQTEENSGLTIVYPVDCINDVVEIERTRSTGLQSNQKMAGLI